MLRCDRCYRQPGKCQCPDPDGEYVETIDDEEALARAESNYERQVYGP